MTVAHKNFRLYSFVSGGYLSPLQAGLQTAHAVADMSTQSPMHPKYLEWATVNKTIIICSAFNHQGVLQAYAQFKPFADKYDLPIEVFHEDEVSLNGAATACCLVVPECFYNVQYLKDRKTGNEEFEVYSVDAEHGTNYVATYRNGTREFDFVSNLREYPLFR